MSSFARQPMPPAPDGTKLFLQHWNQGSGLPHHDPESARVHGSWMYSSFAAALARLRLPTPDAKTVARWKTGSRPPQQRYRQSILAIFFPPPRQSSVQTDYDALVAAWNVADASDVDLAETEINPWSLGPPLTVNDKLVELQLHQPEPDNIGGFRLRATLSLDSNVYSETVSGQGYRISLQSPILQISSKGYRLAPETKLGRTEKHANLKPIPSGWKVENAEVADGGDLIGGDILGHLRMSSNELGSVAVALKGTRHTISIYATNGDGKSETAQLISEEKAAILDLLFGHVLGRDADGYYVLARHSMIRASLK